MTKLITKAAGYLCATISVTCLVGGIAALARR